MKETGVLHVPTGFVIIYPPRKVVWNIILIEKIASKKSILQHRSLNCTCADNAMQLKKWSVIIINNLSVNSKHYYCKQKYMDLTCIRTMIFIQKQIRLLLVLLSAQENQFQQVWKPQLCFAPGDFAPWTFNRALPLYPTEGLGSPQNPRLVGGLKSPVPVTFSYSPAT